MTDAVVYLVGAGPGDPGLITVAGAAALRRAHVVVYDYLANPELLKLCPSDAEMVYVGKSGNQHSKTQDEINAILVAKATAKHEPRTTSHEPRIVVRLKGGDPYVFGRGGEEAEYLRAHGVPFVEVPGITSGIAAPAYAGIPVTHRDFTSTITLVTGHEREEKQEAGSKKQEEEGEAERVNYEALAKLDGTIVFYMGVKSLPSITAKLMAAGMNAATPAAVIRWGTRGNQRTVTGAIGTIVDVVHRAGITAPAITIVGRVVTLRKTLNWFENRPLFGKRILVTRTRQQASELSQRLTDLGAQVIEAPTIEIVPPTEEEWPAIDHILERIPAHEWIVFTSANGVRAAWDRLRTLGFDARHFGASDVGAVGAATAAALHDIGIVPDVLPEKFVGEELAGALQAHIGVEEVRGKRFLLLRADIARPVLREELEKLGALVEDVAIYKTVRPERLPDDVLAAISAGEIDWVTFTSGSTAHNLWDLLTPELRAKVVGMSRISIGPVTTTALRKLGDGEWAPTLEAKTHDIAGVVEAILNAKG